MAIPDALIEQAEMLATHGSGRPRQADLRRAVPAAYYAVFHQLGDMAVRSVLSANDAESAIGARLRRTVTHANVARACKWNVGTPPPGLTAMLDGPPEDRLDAHWKFVFETVCKKVLGLQESRHWADYDLTEGTSRANVRMIIASAAITVDFLRELPRTREVRVFLLACLFGENLSRNA